MNRFKIGNRTLKTGIAVTLSIAISRALHVEPAMFAVVAAIVNLQPTVYQSYVNAVQQVAITFIGIIVGLVFAILFGNNAIIVGIASILVILIALRLKLNSVILVGIVSVIFIVDAQKGLLFEHAFARISIIFIGLLVALFVNIVLAPRDYRKFTLEKISDFHMETSNLFYAVITDFVKKEERNAEEDQQLQKLLRQTDSLGKSIEIFKREIRVLPFSGQAKDLQSHAHLIDELFRFDVQLLNKLDFLNDLEAARIDRIASRGTKNYSEEFQNVVNAIQEINENFMANAKILNESIILKKPMQQWKEITDFDDSINENLKKWQQTHEISTHYLSVLMEVGVIIHELRWVISEQNRLYQKYARQFYNEL